MLVYPSGVGVSSSALRFLAARLRERRRVPGTRRRRLSAGRQALLTLAHLRNGHTYAQLAAGFGIGTTTIYQYITEAVEVLVALAPTLAEAVRAASKKAYLLLGCRSTGPPPTGSFYSGKHKKHGMNVQVIADAMGRLLWASPALAGAVDDVRAARTQCSSAPLARTDQALSSSRPSPCSTRPSWTRTRSPGQSPGEPSAAEPDHPRSPTAIQRGFAVRRGHSKWVGMRRARP